MRRVLRKFGWLATSLLLAVTPLAAPAQTPAASAVSGPPAPAPYKPAPSDLAAQPVGASAPSAAPASGAPTMLKPVSTDPTQPRVRSVIVFGTDPCPKSSSPDEIIVCARQSDEDRYRIPPAVRTGQGVPVSNFTKNRGLMVQQSAGGAGGSIGSCSAVGPGGYTGCMQQQINNWANPN